MSERASFARGSLEGGKSREYIFWDKDAVPDEDHTDFKSLIASECLSKSDICEELRIC